MLEAFDRKLDMFLYQRYKLPIYVLIFLIAAAGRILNIDNESLWVDEGFSYWAIRHQDMFGLLLRDVHPPLYFIGLRGWVEISGITELALRYFSVIPSLLSVVVIVPVARELVNLRFYSEGHILRPYNMVSMLAALMLALADMENYVAQETRMYSWHVLTVLLCMWAFLRWIRVATRRAWAMWIFASMVMLYVHYISVVAIGVQGLFVLLFLRGRKRWEGIGALFVIGVIFIPWLMVVVSGQTENVGTGFNVPSTLESLWNWRDQWFTQQWGLMVGLALLGLMALVIPEYTERSRGMIYHAPTIIQRISPSFLLLMWFVMPVAAAYVLNFYTPILMDYRLTQITPAAALMFAFGLVSFNRPTLTFLMGVIVVYGVAIDDTHVEREPWREVGMNAAQYALPGELAMADIEPSGDWHVIYYYERLMPEVERRSLRQWRIEERDSYPTGLPALVSVHPTVWFMHWSGNRDGFRVLEETGHVQTAVMTEDWLGNDLNMYRYDVVPPESEQLTTYENGMILRDARIIEDQLRVDLWWSVDAPLDADYTVSAIVLDANGALVAQLDSYPFEGARPTSGWQPDEVVYDPRRMALVEGLSELSPGVYTVGVKIYLWTPEETIVQQTANGEDYQVIGQLEG